MGETLIIEYYDEEGLLVVEEHEAPPPVRPYVIDRGNNRASFGGVLTGMGF